MLIAVLMMGAVEGRRSWEYLLLCFVMRECHILGVIEAQDSVAGPYYTWQKDCARLSCASGDRGDLAEFQVR